MRYVIFRRFVMVISLGPALACGFWFLSHWEQLPNEIVGSVQVSFVLRCAWLQMTHRDQNMIYLYRFVI